MGPAFQLQLLVLAALFLAVSRGVLAVNSEGSLLLKWKESFTSDTQNDTANWNSTDETPCTWSGISCDAKLRVVSIFFAYTFSGVISGRLIPELGQLQHLETIDLTYHAFTGPIPIELGQLSQLTSLEFRENYLSGPIPRQLSNCSRLTSLGFGNNLLSGPLPTSLFSLPSLTSLVLTGNPNLSIPPGISRLRTSLKDLGFSGESLPFELWSELGNLTGLTTLDIEGGPGTPIPFPPWIQNLTSLQVLFLRENSIVGPTPAWLKNLPLEVVVMAAQDLTTFPELAPSVNSLNISTNPRLGRGPLDLNASLGALNMSGMIALTLDNCSLEGPIPNALQEAHNLMYLSLASNKLTGPLPPWFASAMPSLFDVDLSSNQLSGEIPDNLGALPVNRFVLSHNELTGSIPASLGNWSLIQGEVALDHNSLSGSIPASLSQWSLYELRLDHNELTGTVPPLTATVGGSLEANFLIGQLPNNFTAEGNCFGFQLSPRQAPLPGQRSAEECRAAYEPLPLTSSPPAPPSVAASSKYNRRVAMAVGGGLGALCLLALLLVLLFCRLRVSRQRRMVRAVSTLDEKQRGLLRRLHLQEWTPRELAKATGNWSIKCQLGVGRYGPVYKGTLADGKQVAIKKVTAGSKDGVDEFINEISTAGKVRSSHIVALIGYGLEEGALVYEYIPNGSLEHALFRANYPKKLTWQEVQTILVGVAEGLVYLHTQCRPQIIHCNIKPANVLLDAEYNPRITDFGLARTVTENGQHHLPRIVSPSAYVAPECATQDDITDKADVYSFGVLLLMAVHRNDLLSSFSTLSAETHSEKVAELLQSSRVLSEKHLESQFLGSAYKGQAGREEVARVVRVGASCTSPEPKVRPSMTTVLSWLSSSALVPPLGSDGATSSAMASPVASDSNHASSSSTGPHTEGEVSE